MTFTWVLWALVRSVALSVSSLALAVLVHEFGHYMMARAMGHKARWRLDRHGPHVWHDGPDLTPWRQAAITLSGAAANVLAAVVLPGWWGLAQFLLAASTLWPHPLSDGWRAAKVLGILAGKP